MGTSSTNIWDKWGCPILNLVPKRSKLILFYNKYDFDLITTKCVSLILLLLHSTFNHYIKIDLKREKEFNTACYSRYKRKYQV